MVCGLFFFFFWASEVTFSVVALWAISGSYFQLVYNFACAWKIDSFRESNIVLQKYGKECANAEVSCDLKCQISHVLQNYV